jgi:pyruvate/2-oxoglutarate dehydrogenase complex dihydrolipoamide acyltransferase (E2) component
MSDLTPTPNFDPVAIGNEIAKLEAEAQNSFTAAKGEYEAAGALYISRSEVIAAILWDVAQNHSEHLDAVCEHAKIGTSRRYELLQIGGGRKSIEQSRAENAARQKRLQDKRKAAVAEQKKAAAAAAAARPLVTEKATAKQGKADKGKSAAKPKPIKSSMALAEIDAFTKHWFPLLNERDLVKAEKLVAKRFEEARASRSSKEAA